MSRESESQDLLGRALEAARAAGADAADAVLVHSDSREARVRGEEIEFVKQAREQALGIRALVKGREGTRSAITSTCDLDPDAVVRMAADAVTLARATAQDPTAGLPEEEFAKAPPDLDLCSAHDRDVPIEARIEDAFRAEAAARSADPRIDNTEGSQAGSEHREVAYANSAGFFGHYESASHSLFSEPIARQNGSMQRDSWYTVARSLDALEDPAEVGRKAATRAVRRLGARRVKTTEGPVIFDEVTAPSLLGHLAACISGYSVYRHTSFLADKLGQQVSAAGLTVIDDGRLPGGLGSRPFDGEGLPTRRNEILRSGVLETWLLDSYSGRKLGLPSTGSAARGAGSPPSVSISNLWLVPGTATLDDMIAGTRQGLLVTELIGMGFDPVSGDYSRGAAGLWIENGEIAYPVEEITIAGNLGEMLESVDAIGSELVWRGRAACPPLRVSHMTIAGE